MTKILITRPVEATGDTIDKALQNGFKTISYPLLKISAINGIKLNGPIQKYSWLLFTSSNAVRFFMDYAHKQQMVINPDIKIAAVGPTTAHTLTEYNLNARFIPDGFNRTAISKQMPVNEGDRILYPTIFDGPTRIEKILKQRRCVVERLDVYKSESIVYSKDQWQELLSLGPDVVTFFSPRTVKAFFENKQTVFDLKNYKIAVLAESSARALTQKGYTAHIKADIPTAEDLMRKIKEYYA